jgi:hypothetical protein
VAGESGSQTIEIPAVASKTMDADDDTLPSWSAPFSVGNAMETVRIKCKEAVLVRLRGHVKLKLRKKFERS